MFPLLVNSQVIMSWNIQDLGKAKYNRELVDDIGRVIAESGADIIAIQELVTSNWGEKCVYEILLHANYNFVISEKTTGPGTERYVYLWNNNVQLIDHGLDTCLQDDINREPYEAIFLYKDKPIKIRQVHLVPSNKYPELEVSLLNYTDGIVCGDFNLTCSHYSYCFLNQNMNSSPCDIGTTLKRDGEISDSNYDHFFVDKNLNFKYHGPYLYEHENRRSLSDHLPIIIEIIE